MSTLLTSTREALGGASLPACTSRALRLTRYAEPTLNEKTQPTRKDFLQAVVSAKEQRHDDGLKSWRAWLTATARPEYLLHAKLEARLLINMGGTVLENAGLQLDRFGTAYLPGSAVKACARRTALATLRQWCETLTNGQPTKPTAADDALAPACAHADFKTPSDLLLAILRVFGCTDLEWKRYDYDNNKGNDLAWACANQWDSLSPTARNQLPSDTLRGSVAFLPAYPYSRLPVDLELDVLTSHHQKYYRGDLGTATDTEDPNPVYFPAVAAEATYTFAVLPVGATATDSPLLTHAKTWLSTGLSVFGLGAKTAAGYGFFSDATPAIAERESKAREQARIAAEEAALKAKQAADLAARKARDAAFAAMTPAQRADAKLADRATDWGWMKPHLANFAQHPPETQAALLRWLAGAGKDRWLTEIKPESAKGKKPWSQIIGAIHTAKKTHKIDLP
jgi:CRISPR type III-B/RAMP module RAMP protein Cmr6